MMPAVPEPAVGANSETAAARAAQHVVLGLKYLGDGDYGQALAWFDLALLDGPSAQGHANRALALQLLGRPLDALAAYRQAFGAGLRDAVAFYNCGCVLTVLGQHDHAARAYEAALRLRPDYPEALCAGGVIALDRGREAGALRCFDEALRLQPTYGAAWFNRGNALLALKRPADALLSFDQALAQTPDAADILINRGSALHELGRIEEAVRSYDLALRLAPGAAKAWSNRGNALLHCGRPEEALTSFDEALRLDADYVEAHCGRGVALKELRRLPEALLAFDGALSRDPASPHARNNKGAAQLLAGDFAGGWANYEWRWIAEQTPKCNLALPLPEWPGPHVLARHLLVCDEQGLGDALQFSRYLPLIAGQGGEVTYWSRRKLHRLLETLGGGVHLCEDPGAMARFDYQISLSSLPFVFASTESSIPRHVPYLRAEQERVRRWETRLDRRRVNVGLCWHGNPDARWRLGRSIPLATFAPLTAIEGVQIVSIQRLHGLDELLAWPQIVQMSPDFDAGPDAFLDTAALMQSLDLVVTCDTSVAHLAGALGVPTFVLLKYVPDWRWLLDRDDSPWYPTMRLFRQPERGDWDGAVARVAATIEALVAERGR